MMRVDDVVADLELDVLDDALELEILDVIDGVGDGVLLWLIGPSAGPGNDYVCR